MRLRASVAVVLLALASGACFRDKAADGDGGEITAAERAAFAAPTDSSLTPRQVDQYLRATAGQFQILRDEAPAARERVAAAQRALNGPAAVPDSLQPRAVWRAFVDAAFVRSARGLGYNPAELWYVRGRMAEVGGHLLASRAQVPQDRAAARLRQQAESMRRVPGVRESDIRAMLQAADQAARPAPPAPRRLVQNAGALRQARNGLSDAAWGRVAGVAAGVGVNDLGEFPVSEAGARLDELRQLYRAAIENREPPA